MADNPEQTEETVENALPAIFVTNGTNAVGMALVQQLVAAGYKVTAGTDLGSDGAFALRDAGAVPVYPDMTRASNLFSLMLMAKAEIVVNTVVEAVNGLPQKLGNWRDSLDLVEAGTQAVVAVVITIVPPVAAAIVHSVDAMVSVRVAVMQPLLPASSAA